MVRHAQKPTCCSVAQSDLTLCNPMDCNTTGFPVLLQLLELTQTHVHWVGDAVKLSHPLSPPFLPALDLSQHQCLFQSVSSLPSGGQSIRVSALASVLLMNIQGWFSLGWTGLISLLSKGLSRVFSNTTVQKHEFLSLSFLHSPVLTSIHDYWKCSAVFTANIIDPSHMCLLSAGMVFSVTESLHFKFYLSLIYINLHLYSMCG